MGMGAAPTFKDYELTGDDASLENVEGEGWRVITGEEKNVNSELSKLKDLLQDSEVR